MFHPDSHKDYLDKVRENYMDGKREEYIKEVEDIFKSIPNSSERNLIRNCFLYAWKEENPEAEKLADIYDLNKLHKMAIFEEDSFDTEYEKLHEEWWYS